MSAARSFRFLEQQQHQRNSAQNSSGSAPTPPPPIPAEADVIVILAALLCALICVVGLALVARCAWLRRSLSGAAAPLPTAAAAAAAATSTSTPPPNKGLKKKVLRSLPKLSFDQAFPPGFSSPSPAGLKLSAECPICLTDFAAGDEIRVLPHCGHGFHVACVDTWLGSRSSCPSCRQILVAAPAVSRRCNKCGASSAETNNGGGGQGPSSSSTTAATVEARAKGREDRDVGRFLP